MIKPIATLALCAALAGCGFSGFSGLGSQVGGKRATTENELPFRARLTKDAQDARSFSVSVDGQGEGVDAVRESVRFEGTKYCLFSRGSSDIAWAMDETTGDWALMTDGTALVFNGRCVGR